MTTTLSIRELTRSGSMLSEYDYIDIEDRKSHQYKGVFVPLHHAAEVKEFLQKKIEAEQQRKINELLQFAGLAHGDFGDATLQDLKQKKDGE